MSITPTYRGFRLQDEYIIWRILTDEEYREGSFLPEGGEDLHVFDSEGKEVEAVQVKAHLGSNLTISKLGHDQQDGFFRRSANALVENSGLTIRLASFGPIGPNLNAALEGDSAKLESESALVAKHGFVSKEEATSVFRATIPEVLSAESVQPEVKKRLEEAITGIAPQEASELLQTWIRNCAEHQIRITYRDLIAKVEDIGKFLSETAAHNQEWQITIRPIKIKEISEQRRVELADGFYQGISVGYEHILAGLDVERPTALAKINSKFQESRVVVVKAASGQGKSAIAYRFIHNHGSSRLCYQVVAGEDGLRAGQTALAMASHAAVIGVPMLVYLDVRPTDYAWPDIVLRLAEQDNIEMLITIREEDWTRGALSKTEVDYRVVEVEFSKDEAALIYKMLQEKRRISDTVNFDDAWNRFGMEGQLIEFVHFVSQGKSLLDRLSEQVERIKKEVQNGSRDKRDLQLLRIVAIATAYEARIKIKRLVELLELPEPQTTVEQFEREYLFRINDDKSLITSLHPIRSKILSELLTDPTLYPWIQSAVPCIDLIIESDLANFLLYVFARTNEEESSVFLAKLNQTEPTSWEMALGIMRALLWYGLKWYVDDNRDLFDRAFSEIGQSLTVAIDMDVAGAAPEAISRFHEMLLSVAHEDGKKQIESYLEEQTDKELVFAPVRTWLDYQTTGLSMPASPREWTGYTEVAFWSGWSKGSTAILSNTTLESIWSGMEQLPLNEAARLLLAVYYGAYEVAESILSSYRPDLIERLRRELQILKIEDDGEILKLHFIMSMLDDPERPPVKDIMNYEAIRRIDICRAMFPDRNKYCSFGYGHKFVASLDSTEKHIDIKNLPLDWLTALNAQFNELIIRKYRPNSWGEFANEITEVRQVFVRLMKDLIEKLKRYFQNLISPQQLNTGISRSEWTKYAKMLNSPPLLPKQIGDPWGFVRISDAKFEQRSQTIDDEIRDQLKMNAMPTLAVGAYRSSTEFLEFWRIYKDVIHAYSSFLDHGQHVLALSGALRNAKTDMDKERVLERAKQMKISDRASFLTLNHVYQICQLLPEFQQHVRKLLSNWLDSDELTNLESEEVQLLGSLWHYWYVLAFNPEADGLGEVLRHKRWREDAYGRVVKQFRHNLQELECDGLQIVEPHSGPQHEGKAAMWVIFDAMSLNKAIETSQLIISAMAQAERESSIGPLDSYVYEEQCSHLIVVPLVRGRSIEWISIVHSMGFTGIQNVDDPLKIEIALCPEVQACDVERWDIPLLNVVWQLRANAYGILNLLQHLREVLDISYRDTITDELTVAHTTRIIVEAANNVKTVSKLFSEFNAIVLDGGSAIEDTKSPTRYKILKTSVELSTWFLPSLPEEKPFLGKEELISWMDAVSKAVNGYEQQLDWIIEAEFEDV